MRAQVKIAIKVPALFLLSIFIMLGTNASNAQGLPVSGTAKLLLIYAEVEGSQGFDFDPHDLSDKLIDFFGKMSRGNLSLDVTSFITQVNSPEKIPSYQEAIVRIMKNAEKELNLEEFSAHNDNSVLDGICIVIDNFHSNWKDNPSWTGIATIILNDQSMTFDNKLLQKSSEPGMSSGLVMKATGGLNYSFWILAHEVGHLFGLSHFPQNEQLPYYQLMNPTGSYWGINRGMSFWEREQLGWIEPDVKLNLKDFIGYEDSVSFYLNDYMTTGHYAKIILPANVSVRPGNIYNEETAEIFLEKRMKISPYDQEKNKGDEGIFIWEGKGELIHADGEKDYSVFPTLDAFGVSDKHENEYYFSHYYSKIINIEPSKGYYIQKYSLPVSIKISEDNRVNITYGPAAQGSRKFISTVDDPLPRIKDHGNYPNPFNSNTKISFFLSSKSKVNLAIFDVLGRQIDVIIDGYLAEGEYSFDFDAEGLSGGLYFYRLMTPSGSIDKPFKEVHTGKMLYVK